MIWDEDLEAEASKLTYKFACLSHVERQMNSSVPLNSLDTESEYLHQSILFHIAVENTRRACITYYDKKIEQK